MREGVIGKVERKCYCDGFKERWGWGIVWLLWLWGRGYGIGNGWIKWRRGRYNGNWCEKRGKMVYWRERGRGRDDKGIYVLLEWDEEMGMEWEGKRNGGWSWDMKGSGRIKK